MAFFPAGLVLYWVVNNLFSFAQQFYARGNTVPRGGLGYPAGSVIKTIAAIATPWSWWYRDRASIWPACTVRC
ncbi:MAG: hypothetical protein CM1200mP9_00240 [Gammaproteobacteria bacterium]|nr:MAG: hypothetical protein CM1200mP9_00240 [Gammaproteobacteria bacterium]